MEYLKKLKTSSRHLILSMGLEFHSQNLKSELAHIQSRVNNNRHAIQELCDEENDKITDSYIDLMALTVLRRKAFLYDWTVGQR